MHIVFRHRSKKLSGCFYITVHAYTVRVVYKKTNNRTNLMVFACRKIRKFAISAKPVIVPQSKWTAVIARHKSNTFRVEIVAFYLTRSGVFVSKQKSLHSLCAVQLQTEDAWFMCYGNPLYFRFEFYRKTNVIYYYQCHFVITNKTAWNYTAHTLFFYLFSKEN